MTPEATVWAGRFGDAYTERQRPVPGSNVAFFARALARTFWRPTRILEVGAGSGENIRALHELYPEASAWAIEVNETAASLITGARVTVGDLTEVEIPTECQPDLVVAKGVLIHIAPEDLHKAYRRLAASSKYVLIAEYFSPQPTAVRYRDREGLLWKRDFAHEFLLQHPYFRVLDYGFCWRFDAQAPQDDITWFLLERGPEPVAAAFDNILRGVAG